MNLHRRILAGTALGLLMGSISAAPLAAAPVPAGRLGAAPSQQADASILLAQLSEEELRRQRQQEESGEEEEQQAPAEEAPAEEAPAEQAPAEQPPAEEPPAAEEPAPEPEAPAAEEPAPETEAPAAEEPAPQAEPPAAEEPQQEPAPEEAPAEEAPAEEAPPAAEEPAPQPEAPAAEETAPEEAPADEQPAAEEPPAAEEAPAEQPAPEEAPAEPEGAPTEGEQAPAAEQPSEEAPAEEAPTEEAPTTEEAPAGEAPAEETPAEQPAQAPAEQQPVQPADPAQDPEGVLPENAAPVLDSQKEAVPAGETAPAGEAVPAGEAAPAEGTAQPEQQQPQEPAGPPPTSDQEAQSQAEPVQVQPLTSLEGQRIDEQQVLSRRERREGAEVVRESGDRVIFQFNNQVFVESDDRPRLTRGARDVYYEDLRGGWTREVVERENGVQVITIRDQYGDVIRRSRIAPDGREYVLVYAGERDRDRPYRWRDPGSDLPPLRLTIPVSQYILEAERVDDPDRYYEFLEQPPVEPVRRLYSIDEVKYSARIRDTVRRIDLDVINFEFGSAEIAESEIPKLEGVANAMTRILEQNPAETFLIEGHTDAVGSDSANLVLSDRRAESVAAALSNVFDIPPENLATQGYGERYLKVATEERSRDNRRVAIRRITPLVAPVASRN